MRANDSIRKKMARETLRTTMAAILLIFIIAAAGIVFLRRNTIDISEKLGDTAAEGSREALETYILRTLVTLVDDKAALSNETLVRIQNIVNMAADNTSGAVIRGSDTEKTIPFTSAEDMGKVVFYLQLANGVQPSDVREEISALSGLEDFYKSVFYGNWGISALYAGTENGVNIVVEEVVEVERVFDPRTRLWYELAVKNDGCVWTDVFTDAFGRGLSIACVKAYKGADGNLSGVTGAGFTLDSINEIVLGTKIGRTGYSFILNESGHMIMSPTIQTDENGELIRENMLEDNYLKTAAENMVSQKSDVELITIDGVDYYIAYAPIDTVSWSFATLISVDEAMEMAEASKNQIIELKDEAVRDIDIWVKRLGTVSAFVFVVIVLMIVYLTGLTAKRLTNPITQLTNGAKIIGDGDLDYKFNINTGDEIQTLSETFGKMIENIKSITADKERIATELNVATQIQASMLPCIFPPYPNRSEFDIYATMLPAKEVGGDFYDFFLVDDNTLAIVVADVSGKGVPAALFMVIAKTLIKNNAGDGKNPREVFEHVNNMLCENNDAGMFVTAFMGYLDIPTGEFTYVNAGHNPPVLRRAEENEYFYLTMPRTPPLAIFSNKKFLPEAITLKNGDEMLLYTDGVTEAFNSESEMYGTERLLEEAEALAGKPIKEVIDGVLEDIGGFVLSEPQSDDITVLCCRYIGKDK